MVRALIYVTTLTLLLCGSAGATQTSPIGGGDALSAQSKLGAGHGSWSGVLWESEDRNASRRWRPFSDAHDIGLASGGPGHRLEWPPADGRLIQFIGGHLGLPGPIDWARLVEALRQWHARRNGEDPGSNPSAIPEPGTALMVGVGLLGIALYRRGF